MTPIIKKIMRSKVTNLGPAKKYLSCPNIYIATFVVHFIIFILNSSIKSLTEDKNYLRQEVDTLKSELAAEKVTAT